jgi:hypothetical protein
VPMCDLGQVCKATMGKRHILKSGLDLGRSTLFGIKENE